jgi:hypothetical protein
MLSATLLLSCGNPLYRYSHTTVQDVNLDGIPDVIYLEKTWNFEEGYKYPIVIRIGTKEGALTKPRYVANIVNQEGGPIDLRLVDVNGDNLPDLTFMLGRERSRRYWMMNNGNDSFVDFRAVKEHE